MYIKLARAHMWQCVREGKTSAVSICVRLRVHCARLNLSACVSREGARLKILCIGARTQSRNRAHGAEARVTKRLRDEDTACGFVCQNRGLVVCM